MKPLLILSLLISSTLFAQRKLKHDIIKETGDTIFYTSDERIYISAGQSSGSGRNRVSTVGDYLKSTVLKYPSTGFALEFSIQTGRTNSFSIYKNHSATLFMADGTEIILNSRGEYSSKKSSMGYGCWVFAFYSLPDKTIESIKNGSVSSIRIESSMGTFDYPLKSKFSRTIAEQLESFWTGWNFGLKVKIIWYPARPESLMLQRCSMN